jgi:hypothetical protein
VNTASDLDTDPVGTVEEDAAAWLGDELVLDSEGVRVTSTYADPTTEEKDALTSEEALLDAAPEIEFELEIEVVVVVVVTVVENGAGVSVLPTKATPTEDEYEPLVLLEEKDEEEIEPLVMICKDVLKAAIDNLVDVTVLVIVPGVGVRYIVSGETTKVLVVDVVMAGVAVEDALELLVI